MDKKTVTLKVRAQELESKAFKEAAEISGSSFSAWARERLRKAAKIELAEAGRKIPFIKRR